MRSERREYTLQAKLLHWSMAALIFVAAITGYYGASLVYGMDAAHDAQKAGAITVHKSIATISLFLIVARILWRVTHRPPSMIGLSPLMAGVAHAGHWLLYALMVAAPLSGWAASSAGGRDIPVAGLFSLPALLAKDKALQPYLVTSHEIFVYALVLLALGHIGFALKHHLMDRDDTLASMSPRRK